jgi:myosin heavy subunit
MADEPKKTEEKPAISITDQLINNMMARFANNDDKDKEPDQMDKMIDKIMKIWTFKMFAQAINGGGEDSGKNRDREVDELRRQLEALREEKVQDAKMKEITNSVKEEIQPIKETIKEMKEATQKQPDQTTIEMREKMEKIEQMIADMDKKKDQDSYSSLRSELKAQLSKFETELTNLQSSRDRGDPLDQLLTQMERLEQTKQRLGKMLGIPSKEVSEMSPTQLIDTVVQKGPELLNSARTMYDIVKGKEPMDENPEPVIPQTPAPVNGPQEPKLQPDLNDFINEGHEEYVDPNDKSKGKMWVSKYGVPIQTATGELMNREDVEKYGLVYPDDLRNLKKQIEDAIREEQEKNPPPPPPPEQPKSQPEKKPQEAATEEAKPEPEKKEANITDEMLDAATKPAE